MFQSQCVKLKSYILKITLKISYIRKMSAISLTTMIGRWELRSTQGTALFYGIVCTIKLVVFLFCLFGECKLFDEFMQVPRA